MARKCKLTKKTVQSGNRVSHSKVKTRHKFYPNLKKRRLWSVKGKKFVTLKLAASTIRSIDKAGGLDEYLKKMNLKNL